MANYSQNNFSGGMNLLVNDTNLGENQYRLGINVRNRYSYLQACRSSVLDSAAPAGVKQELLTFGNYIILFVAGKAYYRYYTATGWQQIVGFQMSPDAPRLWTAVIPVSITNYYRVANDSTTGGNASVNGGINANVVAGAAGGSAPGILVQDNLNQPRFIYLDTNGLPTSKITQTFAEWSITFTDATNVTVDTNGDKREYVPIGNAMAWVDGILYIASQDGNYIYRSVEGRPLDFVVNVTNTLATNAPYTQYGGGDATTTSYSVGVGGITCLRAMSDGSLFVAASNANFSVSKNKSPGAPTIFGEYTFIRTFLFNATCLSERVILDSDGDTKFIDLTGIRSFNAILQTQNEGRNSLFTSAIQPALNGFTQDATIAAAILYDNYEIYGVQTLFGPALMIYDTLNKCWSSFDLSQTGGHNVKMLAKIELTIQRLYAITENDELYTLYISDTYDSPLVRTAALSSGVADTMSTLSAVRIIFDGITESSRFSITPFVDNRLTKHQTISKTINYKAPVTEYTGYGDAIDLNTLLVNTFTTFNNIEQGWKTFCLISWTTGMTLSQLFYEFSVSSPQNPLQSQSGVVV